MNPLLLTPIALPLAGLVIRSVTRLAYGARGPRSGDYLHKALMIIGVGMVLAGLGAPLLSLLIGFGSPLSLVVGYAIVEWLLARREMQRRSIWLLLVNSQQRRQPLEQVLPNHEGRFNGFVGRAFRRMTTLLASGRPLPAAIALSPRAIPRDGHSAIALTCGAPLPSDPRLVGDLPRQLRDIWSRLLHIVAYLFCVTTIGLGVIAFVMIKIVPEFRKIFQEFGLPLPSMTESLVTASNLFVDTPAAVLVFLAIGVAMISLKVAFVCYLLDLPVLLPIADRLMWFRQRAQVLWLLAEAAERKMALASALGRLIGDPEGPESEGSPRNRPFYPSRFVLKRLKRANAHLRAGGYWVESLLHAGLIRKEDASALKTAQAAGNLPWVLRQIADLNFKAGVYRWQVVEQMVLPTIIFFFGIIVAWICVGLFIPLVSLIENLT